jgi:hypothetical protein
MIKARMEQDKGAKLNAGQHLLASATSGLSSLLPLPLPYPLTP